MTMRSVSDYREIAVTVPYVDTVEYRRLRWWESVAHRVLRGLAPAIGAHHAEAFMERRRMLTWTETMAVADGVRAAMVAAVDSAVLFGVPEDEPA